MELCVLSPDMPSWRGVQLSTGTTLTLPLPLHFMSELERSVVVKIIMFVRKENVYSISALSTTQKNTLHQIRMIR